MKILLIPPAMAELLESIARSEKKAWQLVAAEILEEGIDDKMVQAWAEEVIPPISTDGPFYSSDDIQQMLKEREENEREQAEKNKDCSD